MATLAEVQVKINADLAPLRSAFAKAKSMSADLDKALNKSRKTMGATFKPDPSIRNRQRDIEAYAKSLDDLKAKYNPVFAVQRRYANELHDIRRALKVGAITQEEYNAAIRRTDDAFMAQITGMNAAKQAMLGSSQAIQLNNQQLMNMNYQITDLAVMTSSGQNPFIMIMQQGMQMADILTVAAGGTVSLRGAMSAVGQSITRFFTNPLNLAVIGTAAVAGSIPLIWQAVNGPEAKEAEDALERFNNLIDEIGESAPEVGDRIRQMFDNLSAMTYTEFMFMLQQEQEDLQSQVDESIESLDALQRSMSRTRRGRGALQELEELIEGYQAGTVSINEFRNSLIEMRMEGNLTGALSRRVSDLIELTENLETTSNRLKSVQENLPTETLFNFERAMQSLEDKIQDVDSSSLRDEFQEISDQISDTDFDLQAVIDRLDEMDNTDADLSGPRGELRLLAQEAADAAAELERVQNSYFAGMEQDPNAGSRISGAFRTIAEMEALDSLRNDGSSNRGGTSARDRAAEMAANQQFLADLEREVEILSMSYDQREAALQQFEREKSIREAIADLGETATPNQIAQLRELLNLQYELNDSIEDEQEARAEANRMMQQAGNIISNTLQGLVRGTKDLETAVLDAALAFAEMAYQAHMAKLFDTNSSAGGWGGSLLGALFGGLSGRAVGGPVSSNSPYMVGEKGKELFIPHTSGMIVPNSALTNGGNYGNTTQQIDINVTANITGSVSRTEVEEITRTMAQGIRSEIPGAAVKAVSAYQYSGNRV